MLDDRFTIPVHRRMDRWFRHGFAAVDPERATAVALDGAPPAARVSALLAIGKAAPAMLRGAHRALGAPTGPALAITDRDTDLLPAGAVLLLGDHPHPGAGSAAAARELGNWIARLPRSIPVVVLLSGGTSALIAAPIPGLSPADLEVAFDVLYRAGVTITTMNAARRRLTRWSGGRLRAALGDRPVAAWLVSDVPGDAAPTLGSGPLIGFSPDADEVTPITEDARTMARLPEAVRQALRTPPPPSTATTPHHIAARGQDALRAVAQAARREGAVVTEHLAPLTGLTRDHARQLAALFADEAADGPERLDLWSTEMLVRVPGSHGLGGRCQQFALEFALALEQRCREGQCLDHVTVLAAATDGRDGPTDAAGAWSDLRLLKRIRAQGGDPRRTAEECNTFPILDRAGALYRTGPTGTNVADVLLVSRAPR
jgi:hydroxypyruvate reductase